MGDTNSELSIISLIMEASLLVQIVMSQQQSVVTIIATDSDGAATFVEMAEAAGFDGTSAFAPESYDAAALIMLAMQAAGSSASADFKDHVMDVANAPGEQIFPGELAKGLEILANGGDIDYVGASAVELIGPGESAGNYQEIEFADGVYSTIGYR